MELYTFTSIESLRGWITDRWWVRTHASVAQLHMHLRGVQSSPYGLQAYDYWLAPERGRRRAAVPSSRPLRRPSVRRRRRRRGTGPTSTRGSAWVGLRGPSFLILVSEQQLHSRSPVQNKSTPHAEFSVAYLNRWPRGPCIGVSSCLLLRYSAGHLPLHLASVLPRAVDFVISFFCSLDCVPLHLSVFSFVLFQRSILVLNSWLALRSCIDISLFLVNFWVSDINMNCDSFLSQM
jgi:hypothetical protein